MNAWNFTISKPMYIQIDDDAVTLDTGLYSKQETGILQRDRATHYAI